MGSHYEQLAAEERGVIMAMKAQGRSARAIARLLDRSPSTITRELARNGHRDRTTGARMGRPRLPYDAVRAGQRARHLRRKARVRRKLHSQGPVLARVRTLLEQGWSPQQVARRLRRDYPDQPEQRVSHETIYTAIYAFPRGTLRREWVALLRQHKSERRPTGQASNRRGQLPDLPSIHDRPPEANERVLPGHWEGDVIKGARNRSSVGTLVERTTRFVLLVKLEGASSHAALAGFRRAFLSLPEAMRKTLTYDQGKEMAQYRTLEHDTGLSVYFADPRSPWQRGSNENTNGLLRQYLPKGTDLSVYSDEHLQAIAWRLNNRPRKTLDFQTPAEVFFPLCGRPDLALAATQEIAALVA